MGPISQKLSWSLMVVLVAGLLLMSCGQPPAATSTPQSSIPTVKSPTAAPVATWEQKWETVLAEAKKEGSVAVYTNWGAPIRTAVTEAFGRKYGINVEVSPFSRGDEILAKFQAEKRAGLRIASVIGTGTGGLLQTIKPEGVLTPIETLLILPEVRDPKAWNGGKIPYADKEGMALSMSSQLHVMLAYNTDLIKEGEIASVKDVLKPQYKGKLIMSDPSLSGGGSASITHLANIYWGEAGTVDFLTRLIKDQGVVIERDKRLLVETVARGKYVIGMGPSPDNLKEFMSAGAPIKIAKTQESTLLTAGNGAFGIPTGFANPNATTVFINWLLTKEGQTVFAESARSPSMRVDVPTTGIDPAFISTPGGQYYIEGEEHNKLLDPMMKAAKKIMDEAAK